MQTMGTNGILTMDFETTPGTMNQSPKGVRLSFIKSTVKAEQN